MERYRIALAALIVTAAASLAWGFGMDHPSGRIDDNTVFGPEGLAGLVNRPDRVHGFFVNAEEVFFFAGDTAALNEFLRRYSGLPDTQFRVVLHPGRTKARSPWDKEPRDISVDWRLSTAPLPRRQAQADAAQGKRFTSRVDVWLGGPIELDQLDVPTNVRVESSGEIERFVQEHQKKREENRP